MWDYAQRWPSANKATERTNATQNTLAFSPILAKRFCQFSAYAYCICYKCSLVTNTCARKLSRKRASEHLSSNYGKLIKASASINRNGKCARVWEKAFPII